MTIDNLSDDVLLEIFDIYRQTFGDQLRSERVWNNKHGWFKLAHVCRYWRSVVLASPSRLRLRLYFAGDTPTRAVALEYLTHLPIIVDFSNVTWNDSAQERLISALRFLDHVCRIAIHGPHKSADRISEMLDLPFPALESLELDNISSPGRVLLSTSLITSIQSLRRLWLVGVFLTSLFPLFSVARSLVDLTLSIGDRFLLDKGTTFLTHLQQMPRLRNLQVYTSISLPVALPSVKSVLLPALTCFRSFGGCGQIEWLVTKLDTKSLQEFHISVANISGPLHIPYISKFIHVSGIIFSAARLTFLGPSFTGSFFAHPHSIDGLPSKIVTIKTQFEADPGSALSAMLTTLEDIFLSSSIGFVVYEPPPWSLLPWHVFFEALRNVKVLRLHHGLETEVMFMLQQHIISICTLSPEGVDPDPTTFSGVPSSSNGSQILLDIFPSLEEIVVYARTLDALIDEKERASVLKSFERSPPNGIRWVTL